MSRLIRNFVALRRALDPIVESDGEDAETAAATHETNAMDDQASAPRTNRRTDRSGFSLIEVVVGVMLLAVGVLGLGGTTAHVVRQITLSDLMTERSAAFQTTIDRLQSLPYDSVTSGADSGGIFAIRWASVADGPQNKIVTIVTTGPGLGGTAFPTNEPAVADTFQFRILRR